jgi:hypothetical protein
MGHALSDDGVYQELLQEAIAYNVIKANAAHAAAALIREAPFMIIPPSAKRFSLELERSS